MKTSATVTINAPLEQTFDLFTDFEKVPQILHNAHFVDFKSSTKEGAGAQWEQRSGDLEDPTIAIHTITTLEKPNSFTMTSDDTAAVETLTFTFQPNGENQTNVSMSISAATKGCLVFMMAPFLKSTIQQAMTEDLNKMKDYIETQTDA